MGKRPKSAVKRVFAGESEARTALMLMLFSTLSTVLYMQVTAALPASLPTLAMGVTSFSQPQPRTPSAMVQREACQSPTFSDFPIASPRESFYHNYASA